MKSPLFRRWLTDMKSRVLAPRRPGRLARPARLGVESLEDRAVPATHTWTGAVDNQWSNSGNWTGGAPMVGETNVTVIFDTGRNTNQDINNLIVDQISFTGQNNTINLTVPSTTLRGTTTAAGSEQLVSAAGTNAITATATANELVLAGTVAPALRVNGGNTTVTAVLSGTQGFTKTGGGTLALRSVNNAGSKLAGTTANPITVTVADGTLQLSTTSGDSALGTGSGAGSFLIVVGDGTGNAGSAVFNSNSDGSFALPDAATVTLNPDGLLNVPAGPVTDVSKLVVNGGQLAIANGGVFRIFSSADAITGNGAAGSQITGTGTLSLTNAPTVTLADGAPAVDLTIATPIAGGQTLTKTGPGTLSLTGTTAAAAITSIAVNQGALDVSGAVAGTPVTLSVVGSLGGGGTVGAVTAVSGTTISPGLGVAPKTLTTGNLTFGASTFRPTITATGSDQVIVPAGSTVTLTGATLTPNVLSSAPVGTAITVIAVPGMTPLAAGNVFANAAEGATVTAANGQAFTVSYRGGDGNDVTLTPTTTGTASTLSINSPSQPEGNANNNLTFTVTLSAPAAGTVTAQFATANGTATAGSDYTATTGTVTFMPGMTSQTITVPILGDTTPESNETFTVTLTSPTGGATLGTAVGTATLLDDDTPTVPPTVPPASPPPAPSGPPSATGATSNGSSVVITRADGATTTFTPGGAVLSAGVTGDLNGSGNGNDVIVMVAVPGIPGATLLVVDAATNSPYAALGDFDRDGQAELALQVPSFSASQGAPATAVFFLDPNNPNPAQRVVRLG